MSISKMITPCGRRELPIIIRSIVDALAQGARTACFNFPLQCGACLGGKKEARYIRENFPFLFGSKKFRTNHMFDQDAG